jgi:general L-amino acid transport system substrate-binding protein
MIIGVATVAVFGLLAVACGDDDDDAGDGGGGDTLATVQDRGTLLCGVKDSQPGFGFLESDGSYSGNDVEFCRAVAAAVLGDADAVEYVLASTDNRFELLSSGEIDVLIRTTTWTASRDAALTADFTATTFYDGQGMMVPSDSSVQSVDDLGGATICVTTGTTTESNLADQMAARDLEYTPLGFGDDTEVLAAFAEGRCDAWTADKSNLAGQRANYSEGADALRILPDTLSKEPLGPATRDNDSQWHDVVQWVVYGLMTAEELGVTQGNVADMASNPPDINVARLLGVGFEGAESADFGLGIDVDFMQDVIAAVGNFGEVYDRTITPIGLEREGSLNDLWTRGGLIYPPPMR